MSAITVQDKLIKAASLPGVAVYDNSLEGITQYPAVVIDVAGIMAGGTAARSFIKKRFVYDVTVLVMVTGSLREARTQANQLFENLIKVLPASAQGDAEVFETVTDVGDKLTAITIKVEAQ